MIYHYYIDTPTLAREAFVDSYQELLCDELGTGDELTTPEAYLQQVKADALEQADDFGNKIEKLILAACNQVTSLKKLRAEYEWASTDKFKYLELMGRKGAKS